MKNIDKTRTIAKATYQFIKLIPTETKIGAVVNFIGGAAVGNGVVSAIIGDTRKGIVKTIGGIGLLTIGTSMVNNGIEKMSNDAIADFYENTKAGNPWIHVDDDQIADSTDISDAIDHDQF